MVPDVDCGDPRSCSKSRRPSARLSAGGTALPGSDNQPSNSAASPDLLSTRRERERVRREKLEPLLPAIAGALDVREVFPAMATVIQEVLPHETLILALLDRDGENVTVHASINVQGELTRYPVADNSDAVRADWRYFLAYDLDALD